VLTGKIKSAKQLEKILARLKGRGKRVVFTNGCFDLLHYGHVRYLEKARALGDVLVVGMNTDSSVRRLKGRCRPVVPGKYRSAVIAGLASVDYVVLFDEDTPYELIEQLKPDVLVKGADWKKGDIVGGDLVRSRGGKVATIVFEQGFSTTALIKKIAKSCQ
jgi:D-beta-D-heptose 7-phosphate kinase/D-beta-D-heptose 1-phosphate adenosyltransferase